MEARHDARRREASLRGQKTDVAVGAGVDHTKGFEREFLVRAITFWESDYFLRRDGKLIKIDKPDRRRGELPPRMAAPQAAHAVDVGGKTYPAGSLLAANFEAFLKGERKFDVLFEPTERKSLAGYSRRPATTSS